MLAGAIIAGCAGSSGGNAGIDDGSPDAGRFDPCEGHTDCPPPPIERTATHPAKVFRNERVLACDRSLVDRVADTPLRRLVSDEYDNTVRDLLGLSAGTSVAAENAFPADGFAGPFPSNAAGSLTEAHLLAYRRAAERLAADLVAAPDRIAALIACAADADRACAERFIRDFGRRAFRRPLTQEQVDALLGVFAAGANGASFADGVGLVIEAILQSPNFLYHMEDKTPSQALVTPLSGYELAERLSYFLWRTMPDDALYETATQGGLETLDGLRTEAIRMLDDPRAETALAKFTDYWLGIGNADGEVRDSARFPEFSPGFGAAARRETEHFVDYVLRDPRGDGTLESLLTANFSFPTQPLWAAYGVVPPPDYGGQTELRLLSERAGVLTQLSGLLVHSSERTTAIKRGIHVLRNMLCIDVEPPVTGGHERAASLLAEGEPIRTRLVATIEDAECAPCHLKIDPIGYAFAHFDRIGKRTPDDGKDRLDAHSNPAIGDPTFDGPVADATELAARVWSSDSGRNCILQQVHRFALARLEVPEDTCAFVHMADEFMASGYSVRALLIDMVTEDSFRFRPGTPP
jgi:hypothetical protein